LTVNNSAYKYDISSESTVTEGFLLSHKINSTGLKADFNWYRGRNEINYGLDLTKYQVSPGSYLPSGDSSLVLPKVIDKESALEAAVYIDDKFVVTDYMSVNAGVRLSSFYVLGPKTQLVYDPEFTRTMGTVTDTSIIHTASIKAMQV
jgi:hypothetical protein